MARSEESMQPVELPAVPRIDENSAPAQLADEATGSTVQGTFALGSFYKCNNSLSPIASERRRSLFMMLTHLARVAITHQNTPCAHCVGAGCDPLADGEPPLRICCRQSFQCPKCQDHPPLSLWPATSENCHAKLARARPRFRRPSA